MEEHFFQCPHCWEEISMQLDSSVREQTYIEDCEVCCNPLEIYIEFQGDTLVNFKATGIGQ